MEDSSSGRALDVAGDSRGGEPVDPLLRLPPGDPPGPRPGPSVRANRLPPGRLPRGPIHGNIHPSVQSIVSIVAVSLYHR